MVYLGIDMHRKRSHVVAVSQDGEQLLSRRVQTSPGGLWHLFGELEDEPLEVAFESTFGWGWLADTLADAGIPAHMAHPLATKAIASARVKNDAVDAHTLAQLLRGNLLPEAWMAPPEAREARRLARMRASLVRIGSRLKCQVHAILADHGVTPEPSDLFGRRGRLLLGGCGCRRSPKSAWRPICASSMPSPARSGWPTNSSPACSLTTTGCGACCPFLALASSARPSWSPRSGTSPASPLLATSPPAAG